MTLSSEVADSFPVWDFRGAGLLYKDAVSTVTRDQDPLVALFNEVVGLVSMWCQENRSPVVMVADDPKRASIGFTVFDDDSNDELFEHFSVPVCQLKTSPLVQEFEAYMKPYLLTEEGRRELVGVFNAFQAPAGGFSFEDWCDILSEHAHRKQLRSG